MPQDGALRSVPLIRSHRVIWLHECRLKVLVEWRWEEKGESKFRLYVPKYKQYDDSSFHCRT